MTSKTGTEKLERTEGTEEGRCHDVGDFIEELGHVYTQSYKDTSKIIGYTKIKSRTLKKER